MNTLERIEQDNILLDPAVAEMGANTEIECKVRSDLESSLIPADNYPLRIEDKKFLTEVLSDLNPNRDLYATWITNSLDVVRKAMGPNQSVQFSQMDLIGTEIQSLDEAWLREHIFGKDKLDEIHNCLGPNADHPYRKITLGRTTFPLTLEGRITRAYIEKFLVVYSYWSIESGGEGRRQLTTTPLHSHPMNYEVVYFGMYDETSVVKEEEYSIKVEVGERLIDVVEDGGLQMVAQGEAGLNRGCIRAVLEDTEIWRPADQPNSLPIRRLTPFRGDGPLADSRLLPFTDSLFRPHKVTVKGNVENTQYFAINNYISLSGEVYLYDDNGKLQSVWDHDDWAGK